MSILRNLRSYELEVQLIVVRVWESLVPSSFTLARHLAHFGVLSPELEEQLQSICTGTAQPIR